MMETAEVTSVWNLYHVKNYHVDFDRNPLKADGEVEAPALIVKLIS